MPLMRCPHCGEDTFTIAGWTDLDRCAHCGRPLVGRPIELGAALEAKRLLPAGQTRGSRSMGPRRARGGYGSSNAGTGTISTPKKKGGAA